jgi:hypothetical protein
MGLDHGDAGVLELDSGAVAPLRRMFLQSRDLSHVAGLCPVPFPLSLVGY